MSSDLKVVLDPDSLGPDVRIKATDMTEDMQAEAVQVAKAAMNEHQIEKDIAQYIKQEFDQKRGATWHCIVGKCFGSFVSHEKRSFIYFYYGAYGILLFRTL